MTTSIQTRYLDAMIEKGTMFLLIFTPLAIGTVQQWSIAVMELAAFLIFVAWLLKTINAPVVLPAGDRPNARTLNILLALISFAFAGVVLLQIIPLPPDALRFLSPKTASFYGLFAEDPPGAWRTISLSPHATIEELFKLLSYAAIFIVIINHFDTHEKLKGLFGTVLIMGCCLAVFAVLQKMTWNGKLYWLLPLGKEAHPFGPYINKNHFAGYMEMAAPLSLGFYLYTVSKIRGISDLKELPFLKGLAVFLDNKKLMPASFCLVAAVLLSGTLLTTLSRGGIAGFGVSMLALTALVRSRRSLRKNNILMKMAGLLLVLSMVFSGWSVLEKRFKTLEHEDIARFNVWKDAAALVRDHPLLGAGLGTFQLAFLPYQSRWPGLLFEHAENEYIELLAETGTIGFALAMAALIVFSVSLLRQWRRRHNGFIISLAIGGMSAIVALIIHGFTDFNMRIPANAMLFTVISAGTYAMVFRVKKRKPSRDGATDNALEEGQ